MRCPPNVVFKVESDINQLPTFSLNLTFKVAMYIGPHAALAAIGTSDLVPKLLIKTGI